MLLNWYLKSRRSLAQQSPQIGSSTIGKDATAYITRIVPVPSTISPSALNPRNRLPASSPMPLVATGINCFHAPANPRAVVVRTGATLGGRVPRLPAYLLVLVLSFRLSLPLAGLHRSFRIILCGYEVPAVNGLNRYRRMARFAQHNLGRRVRLTGIIEMLDGDRLARVVIQAVALRKTNRPPLFARCLCVRLRLLRHRRRDSLILFARACT